MLDKNSALFSLIFLRPYVVYMLPDIEIIDDWTAIKKALKQAEKLEKKKKEGWFAVFMSADLSVS